MKILLTPLLLLATTAALFSQSDPTPKNVKSPQQPPKIQITDYRSAGNIHILIAKEKGFFKQQGLDVSVSFTSNFYAAVDALASGECDYAGVSLMNIAHRSFTADDTIILAEMAKGADRAMQILVRTDRGVKLHTDLRGKKIALQLSNNSHSHAVEQLRHHEVSLDDLLIENKSPADAANAFISGEVDAIVARQPYIDKIKQQLKGKVTTLPKASERLEPTGSGVLYLATRKKHLKANEVEAKKILRALLLADRFISKEREEAYGIVATHLKIPSHKAAEYLGEFYYSFRHTASPHTMQYQVEWLQTNFSEFKDKKPKNIKTPFSPLLERMTTRIEGKRRIHDFDKAFREE